MLNFNEVSPNSINYIYKPGIKMFQAASKQSSFHNFLEVVKSNYKIASVYAVLVVITALLIAVVSTLILSPANIYWIKGMQIILFVSAGIMNASYFHKRVFYLNEDSDIDKLYFSTFLSILICGTLLTLYFSIDRNLIIMGFASASAFLLPACFPLAFESFTTTSEKQHSPWFVDNLIDDSVSIYINSIQVELQLAQKDLDNAETIYNITLPGQTPFGKLFNRFIFETNKKEPGCIETTDTRRKPYGWEFYVEGLGGLRKKHIDPMLGLRENRIKANSTIIARRIGTSRKKQQRLLSGLQQKN